MNALQMRVVKNFVVMNNAVRNSTFFCLALLAALTVASVAEARTFNPDAFGSDAFGSDAFPGELERPSYGRTPWDERARPPVRDDDGPGPDPAGYRPVERSPDRRFRDDNSDDRDDAFPRPHSRISGPTRPFLPDLAAPRDLFDLSPSEGRPVIAPREGTGSPGYSRGYSDRDRGYRPDGPAEPAPWAAPQWQPDRQQERQPEQQQDWRSQRQSDWQQQQSPRRYPSQRPFQSEPPSYQAPGPSAGELPDVQLLITERYQNPALLKLLATLSPDRGLAAYSEVLQLIQNRHLEPPPPQSLVQRGLFDLLHALQNPDFLQANGLTAGSPQVVQFQQSLLQLSQQTGMGIRSNEDAVAAARWAMESARQLGLHAPSVVVEFIYGAVESLDKFSSFVPPEAAQRQSQQLGASVVGIGVEIEADQAGMRVVKVIEDGPAAQAGLQKGDLIVAVDQQRLAGDSTDQAVSLITGAEGSAASLTVERGAQPAVLVSITRHSVQQHSVTDVQMVDPAAGVAYLKLDVFAAHSAEEIDAALQGLYRQQMQSLILDLRGDPGGLLSSAIDVAKLFVPSGTIVSTRGRNPSDNSQYVAQSQGHTWKVPLILLIDEHSASASEILAAAIQENARGLLVGRHSYGKGTVQTLFPLDAVPATLHLTTARFFSPKGRVMAGAGVDPDIPVPANPGGSAAQPGGDRDLQAAIQVARQQLGTGSRTQPGW